MAKLKNKDIEIRLMGKLIDRGENWEIQIPNTNNLEVVDLKIKKK